MENHSILTERTRLRLIDMSDLEAIHDLHSRPETDEFNTLGIPESVDETRSIIAGWVTENSLRPIKKYTFTVETRPEGEFIGLFGLLSETDKFRRGEVWYKLGRDHWNKGYATECLLAIIRFGFDTLKLHRLEAGCAVDNLASIRVLEKAGMTKEGRHRQILPLKSGWSDNFAYAILESDEVPKT